MEWRWGGVFSFVADNVVFNEGPEILIALEQLPPTPPWRAGSSAVLASLLGHCRRSGGW